MVIQLLTEDKEESLVLIQIPASEAYKYELGCSFLEGWTSRGRNAAELESGATNLQQGLADLGDLLCIKSGVREI